MMRFFGLCCKNLRFVKPEHAQTFRPNKKYIFETTNDRRVGSNAFLTQRIGITIQRGNAASFMCIFPHRHYSVDLFILCVILLSIIFLDLHLSV